MIPFLAIDRQFAEHREVFLESIERVLSRGHVLQGPEVEQLEHMVAALCRRRHAVAVGSCTDALAFALLCHGVGQNDEVLVTGFSFFASVSPIVRIGARPVFVDIAPEHFMMRPDVLDALVTERTKALVAVHLYGQTLPMREIEAFAARHRIALVEDAAQALGARDGDRPAGSMGQTSCLSFDPTKVIGSFSSAGMLLTDDPDHAERARALRYHGKHADVGFEFLGYNSQLPTVMAAILLHKLAQLEDWQRRRDRIASIYLEGLADVPQVFLPRTRAGSSHNWHKFVLRAKHRDELAKALKADGIETKVHYTRALCDEPCIQALDLPDVSTRVPEARRAATEVLSLPMFPELTHCEAERVVARIKDFYWKLP